MEWKQEAEKCVVFSFIVLPLDHDIWNLKSLFDDFFLFVYTFYVPCFDQLSSLCHTEGLSLQNSNHKTVLVFDKLKYLCD